MKYMLLIHQGAAPTPRSADDWGSLSEDEQKAIYDAYKAINETPGVSPGLQLAEPETATTVRVQDGKTLATDGPFAETKEALGGYLLFEADRPRRRDRAGRPDPGGPHGRRDRGAPRGGVVALRRLAFALLAALAPLAAAGVAPASPRFSSTFQMTYLYREPGAPTGQVPLMTWSDPGAPNEVRRRSSGSTCGSTRARASTPPRWRDATRRTRRSCRRE